MIKNKKLACFYDGAVTIHERLLMAEIRYLVYTYIYYLYYCGISEEHILSEVI